MARIPVEVKKIVPAPAADVWQSFRHELDRVFDRFSASFHLPSWRQAFKTGPAAGDEGFYAFSAPAVDVTEDEKAYKITAELPGLDEKNIDVTVSHNMLTLKGEKHHEKEEQDKNRYMSERVYGSFQRSFSMPDDVDRDKIVADLSKGVLTITLAKTVDAQKAPKRIAIKAAA
jgi:HSP20 family protein